MTTISRGSDAPPDPGLKFAFPTYAAAVIAAAAAQWSALRDLDLTMKIDESYWSRDAVTIGPMESVCHWTIRDYLCSQWKAAFDPRCTRGSGNSFGRRVETTAYDGKTAAYLRESVQNADGAVIRSPIGRLFALSDLDWIPLLSVNPLQYTFPRILALAAVDPLSGQSRFPQGSFSGQTDPRTGEVIWTITNLSFGKINKLHFDRSPSSGLLIFRKLEIFNTGWDIEPADKPDRIIAADDYKPFSPGGPEIPTTISERRYEGGMVSYEKKMCVTSLGILHSSDPGLYALAFPKRTRVLDNRFGQLFVVGEDAESTLKSIRKAEAGPPAETP